MFYYRDQPTINNYVFCIHFIFVYNEPLCYIHATLYILCLYILIISIYDKVTLQFLLSLVMSFSFYEEISYVRRKEGILRTGTYKNTVLTNELINTCF